MCISESSTFNSQLLPAVFSDVSSHLWTEMQISPVLHTLTHKSMRILIFMRAKWTAGVWAGVSSPGPSLWHCLVKGMWLWGAAHVLRTPCHPVLPFCRKWNYQLFVNIHKCYDLKRQNPGKSVTSLSPESNGPHDSKKSPHNPNRKVFFGSLFWGFGPDFIFFLFSGINKSTWFPIL